MKTFQFVTAVVGLLIGSAGAMGLAGCSSMNSSKDTGKEMSATGPSILNERTIPETIELSQNLEAVGPAEVLADIKDFRADVVNARLKFTHIPLEIPMQNIGGTTWRARLSQEDLKQLRQQR